MGFIGEREARFNIIVSDLAVADVVSHLATAGGAQHSEFWGAFERCVRCNSFARVGSHTCPLAIIDLTVDN